MSRSKSGPGFHFICYIATCHQFQVSWFLQLDNDLQSRLRGSVSVWLALGKELTSIINTKNLAQAPPHLKSTCCQGQSSWKKKTCCLARLQLPDQLSEGALRQRAAEARSSGDLRQVWQAAQVHQGEGRVLRGDRATVQVLPRL